VIEMGRTPSKPKKPSKAKKPRKPQHFHYVPEPPDDEGEGV